ncbi:hypothetical protein CYLTODRAFT_418576 [Cylindrobasidium torrendii FP15055 ss-10]|uniref:C2H2-type domain-containing protein n=1 Tax=Cylindrobasidium torrendii FP15055 ss-10 TaxID=1314674 RepID=A0A0D7BMA1_9AGAR|nr:hypothetical protein CYLTODRAFT_418576 [Cylindrobasidium torrendii FP15055 ss-10]
MDLSTFISSIQYKHDGLRQKVEEANRLRDAAVQEEAQAIANAYIRKHSDAKLESERDAVRAKLARTKTQIAELTATLAEHDKKITDVATLHTQWEQQCLAFRSMIGQTLCSDLYPQPMPQTTLTSASVTLVQDTSDEMDETERPPPPLASVPARFRRAPISLEEPEPTPPTIDLLNRGPAAVLITTTELGKRKRGEEAAPTPPKQSTSRGRASVGRVAGGSKRAREMDAGTSSSSDAGKKDDTSKKDREASTSRAPSSRRKGHQCSGCSEYFPYPSTLKAHFNRAHLGLRAYACTFDGCRESYHIKDQLTRHLTTHTTLPQHTATPTSSVGLAPSTRTASEAPSCAGENSPNGLVSAPSVPEISGSSISSGVDEAAEESTRMESQSHFLSCAGDGCALTFADKESLSHHALTHPEKGVAANEDEEMSDLTDLEDDDQRADDNVKPRENKRMRSRPKVSGVAPSIADAETGLFGKEAQTSVDKLPHTCAEEHSQNISSHPQPNEPVGEGHSRDQSSIP